ncbi:MAG: lipoprotein signal peptidase [Muribaculaceae bacterium]|nr:lipoprotein signal peptidase [Muribaculaceae bacterium]MDE6832077.1 lipoprotein signal peptidase [Muribaculaceae bacterium]
MTRISPCNFFKNRRGTLALIIILSVLLIDQIIKFWIKTSYYIGQDEEITPWFHLHFIENNGMAFGWEIGSKLLLTTIRIIVTALVCVYIWRIRNRSDLRTGYIVCLALIVAGAAGNIIDCAFYGLIFNDPAPIATATLFPEGGGYGSFLQGRVVDMFYFPIASWDWPSWLPIIGGRHFIFFQPVFNFADAAISVGIIAMLLFYRKDFASSDSPKFVDSKSQAIDGDTKS